MPRLYKEKVALLAEALNANREDRDAFNAIRSLLDKVILHPTENGFEIDLQGDLANILTLSSDGKLKSSADSLGESLTSSKTTKPFQFSQEGSEDLAMQVKLVL